MPHRKVKVVFGHPYFAPKVIEAVPQFFEVLPRLSASFNSLACKSRRRLTLQHRVVLYLSSLAWTAFDELLVLAGNGFGIGAMKIARNLLEVSINAEFLRMNKDAVDDYVSWFWVEQKKWLNYARQHDSDLLKQFTPQAIAETERKFAEVRHRFEKTNNEKTKKELRGGWCAENLDRRASQTHMEVPYRVINPFGLKFLHGKAG
jgi:hypothetical protein